MSPYSLSDNKKIFWIADLVLLQALKVIFSIAFPFTLVNEQIIYKSSINHLQESLKII